MKFHPILDKDSISKLGLLNYNVRDLSSIEIYGIENSDYWHGLLLKYWHYSIYISILYVVFIYVGKMYMSTRPAFNLRMPMTLWSSVLSIISIIGTWRSANVLLATIRDYGFMYSVCHPHFYYNSNSIWGFIFILSKPIELGDTAFIVLRKQPLIFLHWYHHVTVMIYVFLSFYEHSAPGHYFYVINYGVHAIMYTYYSLKSLRVHMPKYVPIIVTSIQLSQMVIGSVILSYVLVLKANNSTCQITDQLLYLGLIMYLSYFVLFAHYFYNAYFEGNYWSRTTTEAKCKTTNSNDAIKVNGIHNSNGIITNGKKHT